MSKEISSKTAYKAYNQADKIIRYLLNPNDDTVDLTATEKKTMDYCKEIHVLRFQFTKKQDIVKIMAESHNISDRQVYNLIQETEQIFGKAEGIHKDYERNFLIEQSRQNIKLAMDEQNSKAISTALMAHYKIVGLDEFVPDMPDFASLEQHKYLINLPTNVITMLKTLASQGGIKFSDIMAPPTRDTSDLQDAEEVVDEP